MAKLIMRVMSLIVFLSVYLHWSDAQQQNNNGIATSDTGHLGGKSSDGQTVDETTHPVATAEDIKEINQKLDNIYTTMKNQDLDGLKKAVEVLAMLGGPVASAFSAVLAFLPENVSLSSFFAKRKNLRIFLGSCNGSIK